MVGIYQDTKRRGIYPPLGTEPEGYSCFSTYQISWIKINKKEIFVLKTRSLRPGQTINVGQSNMLKLRGWPNDTKHSSNMFDQT